MTKTFGSDNIIFTYKYVVGKQRTRIHILKQETEDIGPADILNIDFEVDIATTLLQVLSHSTAKDIRSWTKIFFKLYKNVLIKECSGYHFHYFLISIDRYTNEKY